MTLELGLILVTLVVTMAILATLIFILLLLTRW